MKASFKKVSFKFKRPSGTSRGILTAKESWFLVLEEKEKKGIGECSLLEGLSPDDSGTIETVLKALCMALEKKEKLPDLSAWPAVQMGLETALLSLAAESPFSLYPSAFTRGEKQIPINGLVWMGEYQFMKEQIKALLNAGFDCIKLKIGALDFDSELKLLARVRKSFSERDVSLRVDANGAFRPDDALDKLKRLSAYKVHSIEQPIAVNQWPEMAKLCGQSPIPIALDEELIGVKDLKSKQELLSQIKPHYLILKPSLLGGFSQSEEWIELAKKFGMGWWATSALESNVGLNAIAQWTFTRGISLPQGLGTGSLFKNNFECPLQIDKGCLGINNSINWDLFESNVFKASSSL